MRKLLLSFNVAYSLTVVIHEECTEGSGIVALDQPEPVAPRNASQA